MIKLMLLILLLCSTVMGCATTALLLCLRNDTSCTSSTSEKQFIEPESRPKELQSQIKVDWLYFRLYSDIEFESNFTGKYFYSSNNDFQKVIDLYHAFHESSLHKIQEYAESKSWDIKYAVALNPHTPKKILEILSGDVNESISALAERRITKNVEKPTRVSLDIKKTYGLSTIDRIFVKEITYYCDYHYNSDDTTRKAWLKRNGKYLQALNKMIKEQIHYTHLDRYRDEVDSMTTRKVESYKALFLEPAKDKSKICADVLEKINLGYLDVSRQVYVKIPDKYF